MALVTGGQVVVDALEAEGVEVAFGIPGEHTIALYDGLYHSTIRHILARHEQGAGFMAQGYAMASGRVGVCITTTGPGVFNALTALAEAYGDSTPVLLVCSEVDRQFIGKPRGVTHESKDQLGVLQRAVGWAAQANSVAEIPGIIHEAFVRLYSGRPRPAAVQIPFDVMWDKGEAQPLPRAQRQRGGADPAAVAEAAKVLASAKRPVIWAGGGVNISGANTALQQVAELLTAPVVTTPDGKGAIPEDHPLALGNSSAEGPVTALIRDSDVALVIGTRFQQRIMRNWTYPLPQTIVRIDVDPAEVTRNYETAVPLVGDAQVVLEQLLPRLREHAIAPKPEIAERLRRVRATVEAFVRERFAPEAEMAEIVRSKLDRDVVVFSDTAVGVQWLRGLMPVYTPRSFFTPGGFSTLGFAVPAAIGAQAAYPERQIVAACGDGSFMFTCAELGAAVQENLPVTILLFNNHGHQLIRDHQDMDCGGRHIAAELHQPDFVRFAESFGALGVRADTLEQLGPALDEALAARQPAVVEVTIPFRRPERTPEAA
jgi:thiamine pyrophosphate-dependent acetolactate synthase large subunit-like protein